MDHVDWDSLRDGDTGQVKSRVFDVLQRAAIAVQEDDPDDPVLLATVPRLADLLDRRSDLDDLRPLLDSLARAVGLWNYISKSDADPRDSIVAASAMVRGLDGVALHKQQMEALSTLLSGRNLILSAPTSFGKSLLIDAAIASGKYKRIAIVVPTIALLDEFRRRLVGRFGKRYGVLMHHSEVSDRDRVIFLGTQERLINRGDIGRLDLLVVDEFYKLDPSRRDDRSITLNAAVYKLLNKSKQFFFLGPNIEKVVISSDSRWKFEFLYTKFSTVAVDTFDMSGVPDREGELIAESFRPENWPALVFVSSPDKANELAQKMVSDRSPIGEGHNLAAWVNDNYGSRWDVTSALRHGIGIHHGRIPRALASRTVALFNRNLLPVLICTSTLIEGVNTAAKSVLIYDKEINRRNYDFFTFSNIRGRAGRMGRHHVGRVFIFNEPPPREDVEVSAPLFDDFDDAPDELVVHIGEEDRTPGISDRIAQLAQSLGLSEETLQRFSSIGMQRLSQLRAAVQAALSQGQPLSWIGRPNYDQINALCQVLCAVKPARELGVMSHRQLAYYINRLKNEATFKGFFEWHSRSYRGPADNIDNVFRFLRACEYSLPEYVLAIQEFARSEGVDADYAYLLGGLPRWFRDDVLKNLEERGVPIQIGERFFVAGDTLSSLTVRLQRAAHSNGDSLSDFEKRWIRDALPVLT